MTRNASAPRLTRRALLAGAAALAAPLVAPIPLRAADNVVRVWKSPTCGCCSAWVAHLEKNGFAVEAANVADVDLDQIKDRLGVPTALRSCHTAEIGGYVIEGHVPAGDIALLRDFAPEIAGLAVPGMPIGSPGMEMGDEVEPYASIAFDADGPVGVFARHE